MINYDELLKYGFSVLQINAIKNGQNAKNNLSDKTIKEYFCDLENKNSQILENQLKYNEIQISEIIQGLVDGIDVSYYTDSTIPADSMRQIRKKLNFDKGMDCEAKLHYKENNKKNKDNIFKNFDFIKNFNLISLSFALGAFAFIIAILSVILTILYLK